MKSADRQTNQVVEVKSYVAPLCKAFNVEPSCVICQSGPVTEDVPDIVSEW